MSKLTRHLSLLDNDPVGRASATRAGFGGAVVVILCHIVGAGETVRLDVLHLEERRAHRQAEAHAEYFKLVPRPYSRARRRDAETKHLSKCDSGPRPRLNLSG